ncbi:ABC transporter permease [Dinghuibacter silviterrae]|uniref:Putative ABC transport system permease protein n=1 Tax=Dinghuibacter silviterrae TaxID=1539049 RepID=A0A4R8DQW9_9BACT|nr:ABC transporter permease [Dinghuibacter silviterrae]TDX00554.1 putative ABC transport system permease protein [Dinghuibacter silviterrae]
MLRNYLKIAMAVLKRRKFFTFISLFGISLTLAVLMVATAFEDGVLHPTYPDDKGGRILYVNSIHKWHQTKGFLTNGAASFFFITHYMSTLKTPALIGFVSNHTGTNTYVNGRKLSLRIRFTDQHFWDILGYDFLEGKPYDKTLIDNGGKVAVISEATKEAYFGKDKPSVGKYIEADNVQYQVIGVVRSDPNTNIFSSADIYLPYSLSKVSLDSKDLLGDYTGMILAPSRAAIPKVQQEFKEMFARVPVDGKDYDHQAAYADPFLVTFTRQLYEGFGGEGPYRNPREGTGLTYFYLGAALLAFLFMLLPTLNLISINTTRIMERSSEIGVRKAFGASSATLVVQFIVENVFLTLLGGLIGVALSLLALALINHSQVVPDLHLTLNLTVLTCGLGLCLFFGLLSGVYPAWRMSRLNVVTALKS